MLLLQRVHVQIGPTWGIKIIFFWSKKSFQPKYCAENPTEAGFGHFQPENDSSIHLSPKNLDQALANLLTLAVQHCTEHQSCPNQICQSSNSALVIGTPLFSGAHFGKSLRLRDRYQICVHHSALGSTQPQGPQLLLRSGCA